MRRGVELCPAGSKFERSGSSSAQVTQRNNFSHQDMLSSRIGHSHGPIIACLTCPSILKGLYKLRESSSLNLFYAMAKFFFLTFLKDFPLKTIANSENAQIDRMDVFYHI
jgi:hypothetical protein